MTSRAEEVAASSLSKLLAEIDIGDRLPDSDEFGSLELALERFLPEVLGEAHRLHWGREAFDGFCFAVAKKSSDCEAEFLGLGLIMSDQTWTPIRARLEVSTREDSISWVSCDVGDGGAGGKRMTRLPADSNRVGKLLHLVEHRANEIEWAFSAVRR